MKTILYFFIALGTLLRFLFIDHRELWYDEILSLALVTGQKHLYSTPPDIPISLSQYLPILTLSPQDSLSAIIQVLKGILAEPHPPLFFLLQHFWLRWWGNSEQAMRSLPLLFSLSTIALAYALGRTVMNHRGGLIFSALMALNPFFFFHSLNVRMYVALIFWVTLASGCLVKLINIGQEENNKIRFILENIGFIIAVTAGIYTFYPVIYWMIAAGLLIFWCDRSHWWQYGLRFTLSFLFLIPWIGWGLSKQVQNADFNRFNASGGFIPSLSEHFQGFIETIGIQLLLGDTVTSFSLSGRLSAGILSIVGLMMAIVLLYRKKIYRPLIIAVCLGIVPLLIAFLADILTGKFTLGFGWGRSVSFSLPGLLLLLSIAIEKGLDKQKNAIILIILNLYLMINVADFALRPRQVFHQLSALIDPQGSTLLVMNSQAWGHVLRLAYYLPQNRQIDLLAQSSANLPLKLQELSLEQLNNYNKVIWLDSARPVWQAPKTVEEKVIYQQQMKRFLNQNLILEQQQVVTGTWTLDHFMINVYQTINNQ